MIRLSRRAVVASVAACAVVGAGVLTATSSAGEARYRAVAATTGDVSRTATYDGTIAASKRSDLAFATAGTVGTVRVGVGDEVEAGDVLARLDAQDLRAAVTRAKADLADAEAYLDDVRDGQIDTVTRSLGGADASGAAATGTGSVTSALYTGAATTTFASSTDTDRSLTDLTTQQDAVTSAQTEATTAITAAKEALAAQREACEEDPEASGITQACTDTLAAVQDAQDVVAQRQETLQTALETLSATLAKAIAELGEEPEDTDTTEQPRTDASPPTAAPKTKTEPKRSTPSAPKASAPKASTPDASGGGSGTTATAADLASAQAEVDTAEAALASARADLEASTITAPFDGTVAAVDVAAGDSVAAADRAVVLIGDGDTTATLSVPVDDLGEVEVDQAATVTTASGATAAGRVSAIGLAPESSDDESASTTYRVTVRLDGDVAAPEGSAASVALVTGTASGVVTVPTSAVTRRTATSGTVQVLGDDGEVTRTQVTLGPVSGTAVAVTEGLEAGARVVLADLDAALPSSGSSDVRSITGGGRGRVPSGGGAMPGGPPSS